VEKGIDIRPAPKSGDDPDSGFTPQSGGSITYALEAEDNGGYCLPEAQLDISGEQVARSIYDTLTVPGKDGKYHPYLAQAVDHSADYKTWTITLRSGIKFSDGTDLTAQVVKDNLDAYRGKFPGRSPLLFTFVFSNIANVAVTGAQTVQVTTTVPWVDFDAQLFGQGRLGMAAEAQLKASGNDCATKPIGTGPFTLKEWVPNDHLTVVKNPNYWQKDSAGRQLPYLDSITYRPIIDDQQRLNNFKSGAIQAYHTTNGQSIGDLRTLADSGKARVITSIRYTELAYWMLNSKKAPFNNAKFRQAVGYAVDQAKSNQIVNNSISPIAHGPFSPGSPAYDDNTGFPKQDVAKAKQMIADLKAQGVPTDVVISVTPDPATVQLGTLAQETLNAVGINATVKQIEQSALINNAISGDFQMIGWRNHAGVDPGEQYVWWYGKGNPVNFAGFDDPVINCLLDVGRSAADLQGCLKNPILVAEDPALSSIDPTNRPSVYKELNLWFAKQAYDIWGAYSPWTIATQSNVHGIFGPKLPDGTDPWDALPNGNPALGMWVSK